MALAWLGIIDLISVWTMPDHGLLGLCQAAFVEYEQLSDVQGASLFLTAAVGVIGRALWAVSRIYRVVRRTRRRLLGSHPPTTGGLTFADLGTVACTVGFVRPKLVVDDTRFAALTTAQQRAVVAHERSHARGWHPLVDLAARGLAAGLAPWPGARVAYDEIRRHLEAIADDCAARRTSGRDVAAAIVQAALPPPLAVLGAAGWAAWRVDRLLSSRPRRALHTLIAIALVGMATAAVAQLSGHAIAGVHMMESLHCCRG
jgi:Zn-dependent protease with chaperone function